VRTRPLVLVALLASLSPLVLAGPVSPAAAAPAGTVTTDGWTWEVLTGENDLFGDVTPPAPTAVGGLSVTTTAPTLRAPSLPTLVAFFGSGTWSYSGVSVSQPVVGGPATVTATYGGFGGSAAVTAVVDGGTVEYTIVLPDSLTSLIMIDYDPVGDGYTDAELILGDGVNAVFGEVGGWFTGSPTHHSGAWAIDQLEGDPNDGWVFFVVEANAPARLDHAAPLTAAAAGTGLMRAFIVAEGPNVAASPADTWLARVSLVGGLGCAVDDQTLTDRAAALTAGVADATSADEAGCLSVPPASGAEGVPIDVLLPVTLDPALASASWWSSPADLELITGPLPAGLTATLELVGDEPHIRLRGTPVSAGTTTVDLVLGGASLDRDRTLIDAAGGELVVTIDPALAATGAAEGVPLALGVGAGLLLALGALLVGTRAHRRRLR
jgi:hypothetical protein